MAPLTVYLLARDEVPSSNALKVAVAAQAKVPIAWKLAVERLDVLKIAVDAGRRPCTGETFGRVAQDNRLARWQAIRFRCRIVLPLSVAHASEASPCLAGRIPKLCRPRTVWQHVGHDTRVQRLEPTSTQEQWGVVRSDLVKIWPVRIKNSFMARLHAETRAANGSAGHIAVVGAPHSTIVDLPASILL